jgi:hypothetical protein
MLAIALFIAGIAVPTGLTMIVWARANPLSVSGDIASRVVLFVSAVIGICLVQVASDVAYSDARASQAAKE